MGFRRSERRDVHKDGRELLGALMLLDVCIDDIGCLRDGMRLTDRAAGRFWAKMDRRATLAMTGVRPVENDIFVFG